jgi:cytochrome c-type biogenesis protein CcmH
MIAFVAVAALFVAGALLFVVPPLVSGRRKPDVRRSDVNVAVYRDQLRELESDVEAQTLAPEEFEKAKRELEARVLQDVVADDAREPAAKRSRWTAVVAGIAVPVVAIGLYALIGTPQALSPEALAPDPSQQVTEQQIVEMVGRLAAKLREKPDDPEGWVMLARSYAVLGRFEDASKAYAEATARIPGNAQLLADYADALAMAQGRNLMGEPEKLIQRALAADPSNVKALALAGTVSFEKKDYDAAAAYWKRILELVPPDGELARGVSSSIAEARQLARGGAPAAAAPSGAVAKAAPDAEPRQPAAGGGATLRGLVTLSPELESKIAPNDTVFIYARAAQGPRVPLAVLRKSARELPIEFALDDAMAMAPNMKLSAFPKVIVSARVSKSGNAQPRSGDLQGASGPVGHAASGVKIVIDTEIQ